MPPAGAQHEHQPQRARAVLQGLPAGRADRLQALPGPAQGQGHPHPERGGGHRADHDPLRGRGRLPQFRTRRLLLRLVRLRPDGDRGPELHAGGAERAEGRAEAGPRHGRAGNQDFAPPLRRPLRGRLRPLANSVVVVARGVRDVGLVFLDWWSLI